MLSVPFLYLSTGAVELGFYKWKICELNMETFLRANRVETRMRAHPAITLLEARQRHVLHAKSAAANTQKAAGNKTGGSYQQQRQRLSAPQLNPPQRTLVTRARKVIDAATAKAVARRFACYTVRKPSSTMNVVSSARSSSSPERRRTGRASNSPP